MGESRPFERLSADRQGQQVFASSVQEEIARQNRGTAKPVKQQPWAEGAEASVIEYWSDEDADSV